MTNQRQQKRKANEMLDDLKDDLVGYEGNCLFVIDDEGRYCNRLVSINRCHIVPESSVLSGLKNQAGKVLELQWGISQWRRLLFGSEDPASVPPFARPPGATCVGRFACKRHSRDDLYSHDDDFQPIDVAKPDFSDPVVRFLAGYRLALFNADQYRLAIKLQRQWDQKVRRNPPRGSLPMWLRYTQQLQRGLEHADSVAKLLGNNWHARKTPGGFDP